MRIAISGYNGVSDRIVEFKSSIILSADGISELLLELSGCGSYPNIDLSGYDESNHGIKKELLIELVKLAEDGDDYREMLLFYNDDNVNNQLFELVDTQDENVEAGIDGLIQSIYDNESLEHEEISYRLLHDVVTGKYPEYCAVIFKDNETLYDKFDDVLSNGYIDTSEADIIILGYTDLSVRYDEADEYIVAYKVEK